MMRSTMMRSSRVVMAAFLALAAVPAACGGEKPPQLPENAGQNMPAGSPVSTTEGQEVGIAAGPDVKSDLDGAAKATYDKAFQAWMTGDLQAAKAGFKEAANQAPKAASPHYSLGCVLERLGDVAGAQQEYRTAFTNNPKYEVAMGALALSLARTGHAGEADTFLTDKHTKSPDSVRITTYLAEVKSLAGDSTTAQQLAQEALHKDPDFKEAMVVVARDYYRARRYDVARYALNAVLEGSDDGTIPPRDKDNAEAHLLRGLIERELGERRAALADFEAASKRRPDLFEAYVNAGEMKLEAGNGQEALGPLEKAVRYAPNSAVAHMNLGDCYRMLGRPGDAKKEYQTALSQDSSLAGVHYNLGLLYLFSTNVPGAGTAEDQVASAIKELETFKSMRGPKPQRGAGDDVDDLLSTAKRKQGELKVKSAAAAAAAAPPAGADAGAPAPTTAADGGAPATPAGDAGVAPKK
jgi:tetratricopeptide (TPR) repeat protein